MQKGHFLQFNCQGCQEPVCFSLFDLEMDEGKIVCSHCYKIYILSDETLKRQLGKFGALCKQILESEEILDNTAVGIDIGEHHIKIPYKLLLTRLTSNLNLRIGNEQISIAFRMEPLKDLKSVQKKEISMNEKTSILEQLKAMTTVVCDTGDIDSIRKYHPTDATTNPSLILAAIKNPHYKHLIDEAVEYGRKKAVSQEEQRSLIMDRIFINFGKEILKSIPGRVSTEVNAHLSFDTQGSIAKAKQLIAMYAEEGIPKERVLVKLASTWEGIQAAKELELQGIHCNMTLLFSLPQAILCAEAKATLISPFVGRILDWYKKNEGVEKYAPEKDPGVISVTEIYHYFKAFNFKTEIMGASFRNTEEIIELAGCDLLTISPNLLEELQKSTEPLKRKLEPSQSKSLKIERLTLDEKSFRWMLNNNAMATEKLAEGIRKFGEDGDKLEKQLIATYQI